MANNLAQEVLDRFKNWESTVPDEDWSMYVHQGALSINKLSKEAQVSRSAFYGGNDLLKERVKALEERLIENGIVSRRISEGAPKASESFRKQRSHKADHELRQALQSAQTRNAVLKEQLIEKDKRIKELESELSKHLQREEMLENGFRMPHDSLFQ